MKVFVIMTNDYPHAVMDDGAAAEKLCDERNAREKERHDTAMKNRDYGSPRIYWKSYGFEVSNDVKEYP